MDLDDIQRQQRNIKRKIRRCKNRSISIGSFRSELYKKKELIDGSILFFACDHCITFCLV